MTDYAHVLSAAALERLDQQLTSYEPGTTRKIVVAIFPTLGDESLEDYSIRLAEAWKVGYKDDKGVLVTLFIAEHKVRIDVGYGLEGQLTDALSARIIDELMKPKFRAGDYEGGLRAALAAIDTATGGQPHPEGKLSARSNSDGGQGVAVIIFILIVVVVLLIIARRRGGGGGGGGLGFWTGFFLGGGGGGWSGGSGGWSSHGGGGWSAGGGGSFGGGGASGSW